MGEIRPRSKTRMLVHMWIELSACVLALILIWLSGFHFIPLIVIALIVVCGLSVTIQSVRSRR